MRDLERALGYTFQDQRLLEKALTHSSYANEKWKNGLASNERLEFLGDSILGFVVAEYLYRRYPDHPEGDLTRMRADLVCETSLARAAAGLRLGEYLKLGHGEDLGGGRTRNSITADAVESVIAASYLDGGFPAARGIVERLLLSGAPERRPCNADVKTALQELVQRKKHQVLSYTLLEESGPDHDKTFRVEVTLNGQVVGAGAGSSKKRAEQAAAEAALEKLAGQF
ncbi:MAG: ribonuclease III [Oscillospiraceae bacterium]|nr:ribonuclease III [Oscillospiraceae bacterium]